MQYPIILSFNNITDIPDICQFRDGSILATSDQFKIGVTSDEQECARLVRRTNPGAKGATLYGGNECYAEYGREVAGPDNSNRYCFFGNII